jgi:mannitol-1-/sugar-/sorbitol-6-phosphatase
VIDFDCDAVLFDLDGTLVDSTAAVIRAWQATAAKLDLPFAVFEPYLHGIPGDKVLATVAPHLAPEQIDQLSQWMLVSEAADTDGVVAAPGALEAVEGLPPDRWAIVTSGDTRLATARIAAAGLPKPAVLVTIDDVRAGKPDPEPYRQAAARLGFAPGRCLVVEDAPAGVESGQRAGMPVLGVLTTYPRLDATATVPDLSTVDIATYSDGLHVTTAR